MAIIGGGISGIIAAKQLRYFGFKVTVFEAMLRFGGRICTIRLEILYNINYIDIEMAILKAKSYTI